MKKTGIFILILVLMLSCLSVKVFAHEVPDLTQNGTITLTITYQEKELNGGELQLYRVGNVREVNGDFSFVLTEAFGSEPLTADDLNDAALADELSKNLPQTPAATAKIEKGKATFADVEPGLYLVYQKTATPGYKAMKPFLISMPNFVDGKYVTDITADPKVGLETVPVVTQPSLPQTGQLNWPIPTLFVLGLALVVVGIVLRNHKKATYEE